MCVCVCIVCAVHAVCDPPLYVAGLDSDNDDDTQSESSHTYNGKAFLVYTLKLTITRNLLCS